MQAASARRCFQPPDNWPGELVAAIRETHAVHDVSHRLATARHLVDARHQVEVFEHREIVVVAEFLRHIADVAADQRRLPDDVEPQAGTIAAVGDQEAAQHADGGGLAAAIGAEKAANLALGDLQAQPLDDFQGAKTLAQIMDVDDVVRSWRYNQRVGVLCDRHFNLHGKIALSLGPLIK